MANMSLKKVPMPEQEPLVRARNFQEVTLGYTEEMAVGSWPLPELQEPQVRGGLPRQRAHP